MPFMGLKAPFMGLLERAIVLLMFTKMDIPMDRTYWTGKPVPTKGQTGCMKATSISLERIPSD